MHTNRSIGEKVKALRTLKNIEADDLATRTKLSADQLSVIESGASIPSLGVLIRITRALGVRLDALLEDAGKEGPSVVRANDRQAAYSFSTHENKSREHLSFYSLAPNKTGRHMEPFIVDIVPDNEHHLSKSSHEGEEFIYVMEGKVIIYYGTDVIELEKGDSIYYDSIVEHLVTTTGPKATILGVVYVPF